MKKLNILFTSTLVGLSFNSFGQHNTTSYSENNNDHIGGWGTYIGIDAGTSIESDANFNTFVGWSSGSANIDGDHNTFLGSNSGTSNQTGNFNTFTGSFSGRDLQTGSYNTFNGYQCGLLSTEGDYNTFLGAFSGMRNTGDNNVAIGRSSGTNNKDGVFNTFSGAYSGRDNTSGSRNTFLGAYSGRENEDGIYNTFLGYQSGRDNTSGDYNTFSGINSGLNNETGNRNVALGYRAGFSNVSGNNNVFIGASAGFSETTSNKLYIEGSGNTTSVPLIYGDFSTDQLTFNGKVSTGSSNFPTTVGGINISGYTLFVEGGLLSEEVRVRTDWADYVFKDSYQLKSLNEVESYINKNGHLPNVPSATEVEASGIEMGEITKIQQEKIEELTLYIIEQNKRLEQQNTRIEALEAKMSNK